MATVLLISDRPEYSEMCRTALRRAGHSVLIRDSLIDGLRELSWYRPKVVVCDTKPDTLMTGRIAAIWRDRYHEIPIVLILGEGEIWHPLVPIAAAVVPKSESFEALVRNVQELMGAVVPNEEVVYSYASANADEARRQPQGFGY